MTRPLAVYYEHPDWFRPLFAELDSRGINYVKLNASRHSFDPAAAGYRVFAVLQSDERIGVFARERSGNILHSELPRLS